MSELVRIKNFASYMEAQMAKDILAQLGIESVLQKGNRAAVTEFAGSSGDGDLFVKEFEVEKALEILRDYMPNT